MPKTYSMQQTPKAHLRQLTDVIIVLLAIINIVVVRNIHIGVVHLIIIIGITR